MSSKVIWCYIFFQITSITLLCSVFDVPQKVRMESVCQEIGANFHLDTYTGEVFTCAEGKDTSTTPVGSLNDEKKDRKVLR